MSEGGSIAHRMKVAEARTEELNQSLLNAGSQLGPRSLYRLSDDEFQHHVSSLVHERLFCEKLGISKDEYRLMIQEVWNEELAKLIAAFKQFKADQIREQLTRGIVVRPDIET